MQEVPAMRSIRHLLIALAFVVGAMTAVSCLSNPTPHPGTEDPGGFSSAGGAGAGGGDGVRGVEDRDDQGLADTGASPAPVAQDGLAEAEDAGDGTGGGMDDAGMWDDLGPQSD